MLKLKPILVKGLLRVGSRHSQSLLDENAKNPLILPGKNHFVCLLTLHGRVQLTLITLRRQYWILSGRQAVKWVIHNCFTCLHYSSTRSLQQMGDLHRARVLPGSRFQRSGVDYAGPISVRLSKTRGQGTMKGYIAILVCQPLALCIWRSLTITRARLSSAPSIASPLDAVIVPNYSATRARTLSKPTNIKADVERVVCPLKPNCL